MARRYPPDMDFYDCPDCGSGLACPEDGSACRFCAGTGDPDYVADSAHEYYDERDFGYDDDYAIDGVGFADPGGRSALRAATPANPRDQDCPTCGAEKILTRIDRQRGYQCDRCADQAERGW